MEKSPGGPSIHAVEYYSVTKKEQTIGAQNTLDVSLGSYAAVGEASPKRLHN